MMGMRAGPLRSFATIASVASLVGSGILVDRVWLRSQPADRPSSEASRPATDGLDDHDDSQSHEGTEPREEAPGDDDPGAPSNPVVVVELSRQALANIGLTTDVLRSRQMESTLQFPGVVRMHPDGVASVSTRIQGKVMSVAVAPGDPVEPGQILARIQSLVPGNPPPTVDLVAPIGGIVVSRDAVMGQAVQPNKELFRLIDPQQVVAEAQVPERIVDQIRLGQSARVHRFRDHGDWSGRVTFVGSEADAATRTYPVWIALSAGGGAPPRPGQFVDVLVVMSVRTTPAVPEGAIVEEGPLRFVFVRRGDAFERRLVSIGVEDSRNVEILAGLQPGDTVAVTGSYELLLALESGGGGVIAEETPHEH